MRKPFFLFLLMLSVLTARAQYGVQVWNEGKYTFFLIDNVDSIRFVRLVTDIYLSDDVVELKEGETKQLTASVFPVNADDKGLTWSSSSPDVASVDASGLVTAVSSGTALITVSTTDGSDVKAECQITVTKAGGGNNVFLACPDDNHPHAIDLGLPSGTWWCCCNVGASTPEGYGGYYAWGETWEKNIYNETTYAYWLDIDNDGVWETGEFTNIGSDIAGTPYDAATVNMGAPWRMPSLAQLRELVNHCSRQWTTQNGVNGILVTGPNGGSVFLPAAGGHWNGDLNNAGHSGNYWSCSINQNAQYTDTGASGMFFKSEYWYWYHYSAFFSGRSVRAVCP